MKKTISFFALLYIAITSFASTIVTSPIVSGHWTLAGSPYLIYNNIQVATDSSLAIDPGVNVIFEGSFKLSVFGILYAVGTSAQQITFTVNDTTGWSTDTATSTGGWGGIQYQGYYGTATDTSSFKFCNISYVKIDSIAATNGCSPLMSDRALAITNCNIFNNKSLNMGENYVILLAPYPGGLTELGNCNIYNNQFHISPIIIIENSSGGNSYIHDNNIYKNSNANATILCAGVNMLFENNLIYQNSAQNGTIGIYSATGPSGNLVYSHATIKGNKIYENTNVNIGAIKCVYGFIDIADNLICNNQHTISGVGVCGLTNATGGVFLVGLDDNDSTSFIVRNNIIANNYSPDWGGGIEVLSAKTTILNNDIINNKAQNGGAIWIADDSSQPVTIKNNIFYGNVNTNTSYNNSDIAGNTNGNIEYDHNWTQYPFYEDINIMGGPSFSGDTSTNVIGLDPALIAPTLTANITESAVTANFALLSTSPCINMGDTVNTNPDSVDYAGNPRIIGTAIDIGAYEFDPYLEVANNLTTKQAIEVYPNPSVNILFISIPTPKGIIAIQDISGNVVAQKQVTSTLTTFDIHAFSRGIYFAVWNDGNGSKSVQKIVVE